MFENITVRKLNLNHESFLSKKEPAETTRGCYEKSRVRSETKTSTTSYFLFAATIEADFKRNPANTEPQLTLYGE